MDDTRKSCCLLHSALMLCITASHGCAPIYPTDAKPLDKEWGIAVVALRSSAGGNMLDFRYRVTDPAKAKPILDRKTKAYLIDKASGARLIVPTAPKVGSLRQTDRQPKAGRVYFMLFSNPGKLVKRGGRVDLVIGDYILKDMLVE